MKKILFVFSYILLSNFLLFISCENTRTEPEFTYVVNNSSYDINIYSDKTYFVKSQKNIEIDYTGFVNVENYKIVQLPADSEMVNVYIVDFKKYQGFHRGKMCNIIKISNKYNFSDKHYKYVVTNSHNKPIDGIYKYCEVEKKITINANESFSFDFPYSPVSFEFFLENNKLNHTINFSDDICYIYVN